MFLKGEVGQHGPPGPTLFVEPPDLNLYKGEKVSPTSLLGHLVKHEWEAFWAQAQGWATGLHQKNLRAASLGRCSNQSG